MLCNAASFRDQNRVGRGPTVTPLPRKNSKLTGSAEFDNNRLQLTVMISGYHDILCRYTTKYYENVPVGSCDAT